MEKTINIKLSVLLGIASMLLFSSCLKNNKYYTDFTDYKDNVELPLAAANINQPALALFDDSEEPVPYFIVVRVASMEKPKQPVTVKLALDEAYLNQYNEQQQAAADAAEEEYEPFQLLDAAAYSFESWEGTIQPGEREVRIPVMINVREINLDHKNILPITIEEASIDISNWKHLLINVSAKNEWDGKYIYTATTSLGNADHENASMATLGKNSVVMNLVNYYSNEVIYTINADNSVTVSMGAGALGVIATQPGSKWDPDTKTFHVKWSSNNGARVYDETYEKVD